MRALATLIGVALVAAVSTTPAAQPASPKPLAGKRVDDSALARQRGGADTSSGTVSGNQATNVVTGNNTITGGALAGAAGVPVVIQNSGNNVLIQSATIVNVQVK